MDERSPYAAPTSKLTEQEHSAVGGSVERAIAGDIRWDIGSVLSEGWEKTNGYKGVFWLAVLIYVVAVVALLGVEMTLLKIVTEDQAAVGLLASLMALVRQALMVPMAAGFFVLGIRRAANLPLSATILFAYYHRMFGLFFLNLVMGLLIILGFLLLVLPGIYLAIAYMLAMPLMVEKNMGIWEALETSRKALTHGWFSFFALVLVSMILVAVAMIPLGIGLIWALPMLSVTFGVVYVRLFGVDLAD